MVIHLYVNTAWAILDLYKETLEIFRERKFLKADLIIPIYICSIGNHMFNFVNKHREKPILTEGDQVMDTRLHIFMVTIPGFGKTYTINQFGGKSNGILKDTDIETGKVASITSSGMVGSIKSTPDGNTVTNRGVLQRKANAILMSDEFSNVTTAAKTAHSMNLIDDLLTALDTGEMNKDQSGGALEYDTWATVWAATQTGRFDMKSGLIRRFAFIVYMPDAGDVYKLRQMRRESKNIKTNLTKLLEYKLGINARKKEINENLKEVIYPKEYYDWINEFYSMHYEDALYERILLGYWLMKSESIGEKLVLKLNDEVKLIMRHQMADRLLIQRGVQKIRIMEVIKFIKTIKLSELYKLLFAFALDEKYIERGLDALVANKMISINKDTGIVTNHMHRENGEFD